MPESPLVIKSVQMMLNCAKTIAIFVVCAPNANAVGIGGPGPLQSYFHEKSVKNARLRNEERPINRATSSCKTDCLSRPNGSEFLIGSPRLAFLDRWQVPLFRILTGALWVRADLGWDEHRPRRARHFASQPTNACFTWKTPNINMLCVLRK